MSHSALDDFYVTTRAQISLDRSMFTYTGDDVRAEEMRMRQVGNTPGPRLFSGDPSMTNERTLTYLAVPYSHPDPQVRHARFVAANKAAGILMARGEVVFSPISHTHPIAEECDLPKGWDYWQNFDRAYLAASKKLVILTLEGWRESVGVNGELAIVAEMGVPVYLMLDCETGECVPYPQECGALEPDIGGQLTPSVCSNARPCERHDEDRAPRRTLTESRVWCPNCGADLDDLEPNPHWRKLPRRWWQWWLKGRGAWRCQLGSVPKEDNG